MNITDQLENPLRVQENPIHLYAADFRWCQGSRVEVRTVLCWNIFILSWTVFISMCKRMKLDSSIKSISKTYQKHYKSYSQVVKYDTLGYRRKTKPDSVSPRTHRCL